MSFKRNKQQRNNFPLNPFKGVLGSKKKDLDTACLNSYVALKLEQLQRQFSSNCGNSQRFMPSLQHCLSLFMIMVKISLWTITSKFFRQRYERQYPELCLVSKNFVDPSLILALPSPQKVGCSVLFLFLTIKWWKARGFLGSIFACQDQQQLFSMFLGKHIFAGLWNHLTDKLNFALLCDVEFFTDTRSETSC